MAIEKPLAHRLRPTSLDEFFGQSHLVEIGKPLRQIIESKKIPMSIIFWGPPGTGKTTLAKLISKLTDSEFVELSAVNAKKEDVQKTVNKSKLFNKKIVLFLDEIHRFNKAQQDFLLPFVENGTITLIGATTENPSFEVISALLSRSRVFVLNQLAQKEILKIIDRALTHKEGLNNQYFINEENKKLIANLSNGDARNALNILEIISSLSKNREITKELIENSAQKFLRYDKDGEEHYNLISALHKSMRDSDVDASVYWTMRLVEGGEKPEYITRRMIRFASEDIGNADPEALKIAVATKEASSFLGYPECSTALVQCATYLAKAPKSNKVYVAVKRAQKEINETGNLPVQLHLRNAETKLMKDLGYGKDYKYFHDDNSAKEQQHLPDGIKRRDFYSETN